MTHSSSVSKIECLVGDLVALKTLRLVKRQGMQNPLFAFTPLWFPLVDNVFWFKDSVLQILYWRMSFRVLSICFPRLKVFLECASVTFSE